MCIFSKPVVDVKQTKIFARLQDDGWQNLVYQMHFESRERNAMILPIPVSLPAADEGAVEFVSLKKYEDFFEDLQRGFPIALPQGPPKASRGMATDSRVDTLKVYEVGDFVASFVPTLADFDRLDSQFRIPQQAWDQIPVYSDYGFVVFELKSRRGKPHPMAFRFRSRLADTPRPATFFPTVHIHDGEVHKKESFDHVLYLQSPEFDQACGDYVKRGYHVEDKNTGYARSINVAREFCDIRKSQGMVSADSLVHRKQLKGKLANQDVLAKSDLSHVTASLNHWLNPTTTAMAAGAVGFGWLIQRRNRVAAEKSALSSIDGLSDSD